MSAVGEVPLLRSSKNVWKQLTQGLRPGLCRSIAPLGLSYVFPISILYYSDALALINIYYCLIKSFSMKNSLLILSDSQFDDQLAR